MLWFKFIFLKCKLSLNTFPCRDSYSYFWMQTIPKFLQLWWQLTFTFQMCLLASIRRMNKLCSVGSDIYLQRVDQDQWKFVKLVFQVCTCDKTLRCNPILFWFCIFQKLKTMFSVLVGGIRMGLVLTKWRAKHQISVFSQMQETFRMANKKA